MEGTDYHPGDVFQITEAHGRAGWVGAFLLCTKVWSWGVMGFVHMLHQHEDPPGCAYIRLPWEHLAYIGRAVLVPAPEAPEEEAERG